MARSLRVSGRGGGLLFVAVGLVAVLGLCGAQTLEEVEIGEFIKQLPSECEALGGDSKSHIFHVPSLSCIECPAGQVASEDGFACRCGDNGREDYVVVQEAQGPELQCFDCSTLSLSVTEDKRTCIPCGNSSTAAVVDTNSTSSNTTRRLADGAAARGDGGAGAAWGGVVRRSYAPAAEGCSCPPGHVLSDFMENGSLSLALGKHCTPCPFNSWVDPVSPKQCTPCPDVNMRRSPSTGLCECQGGTIEDAWLLADTVEDRPYVGIHVCINEQVAEDLGSSGLPAQFAVQTMFDVIDVGQQITDAVQVDRSAPFMQHYLASATRCRETRHWSSCQALANLCALTLYTADSPACKVLSDLERPITVKDVHTFKGWVSGLPWLSYEDSTREVLEATAINRVVALQGENSLLNMTLTVYRLDGSYVGMEAVSTQLVLCKGDDRLLSRYRRIGTDTSISCSLDLQSLLKDYDEPLFYELWVDDSSLPDGTPKVPGPALYPVPVIIGNYRDGSELPNKILYDNPSLELGVGGEGSNAITKVVMHRRFFLWDNVSGRKVLDKDSRPKAAATSSGAGASAKGAEGLSDLQVVRWAKKVELRVKLRKDDPDTPYDESIRIFPPYLFIEYEQQVVSTIPEDIPAFGDERETLRYPKIEFQSAYIMDLTNYWYISMILFIVLVVVVVVIFGVKVSVRNQSFSLSPPTGLIADLLGTVADAFFWFVFVMTGYWFFFFKLQVDVQVLLPLENPHHDFLTIVISCIVCKILQVLVLVYRQCNVDIFFIDWEKERGSSDQPAGSGNDKDRALNSNVSVWRTILIANEWCEMQGSRHTDIDFTLMFLLLFLAGLDFQYLATPQPDSTDLSKNEVSIALRFFVICMWYFCVVLIQLAWTTFSYRFIQDPLDLFVDLCQLANISTFVLDETFHGYYIHGRAVHPHADVNMHTMQANLQAESDGNLPYRGLTQTSREDLNGASNQVFEMYIPDNVREEYDTLFGKVSQGSGASGRGRGGGNGDVVARAYHNINTFLQTNVVDEVVTRHSSEVSKPGLVHKLIGMPPKKFKEYPVLIRDNSHLYSNTLFYGIEYDLVIFDLLIFIMWDLIFMDVFIAALLCYITSHALIELRCTWGGSNIAKKTLVDERFLV
mmetsp:Transcript_20051/g.48369  ORF Transcript_20051/g.48369 Transcript_20051/m.48369 type:complete len:1132 (-) Transcript_20051:248-3643(-)